MEDNARQEVGPETGANHFKEIGVEPPLKRDAARPSRKSSPENPPSPTRAARLLATLVALGDGWAASQECLPLPDSAEEWAPVLRLAHRVKKMTIIAVGRIYHKAKS